MLTHDNDGTPSVQPVVAKERSVKGLGYIVESLFKYRFRMLAGVILGISATLYLAGMIKPAYLSEATLYVKRKITDTLSEEPDLNEEEQNLGSFMDVHMMLLQSWTVHEAVAKRLLDEESLDLSGVIAGPVPAPRTGSDQPTSEGLSRKSMVRQLVSFIQAGLNIGNDRGTRIIRLSFEDTDPHRARDILAMVIAEYQRRYRELNELGQVKEVWVSEFEDAKLRFEGIKQSRAEFREQHKIYDLEEQRKASIQNVARLSAEQQNVALKVISLKAQYDEARKALAELPPMLQGEEVQVPNPEREYLEARLRHTRTELATLSETDSSPRARQLRARIESLRSKLAAEPPFSTRKTARTPNPAHADLERRVQNIRIDIVQAKSNLSSIDQRLDTQAEEMERLEELRESMDGLDDLEAKATADFIAKQERLRHLERAENLEAANVLWSCKVLQKPTIPARSSRRRAVMLTVLGLGLSIALGVMLAIGSGLIEGGVRGPRQLTDIAGVAPIATLPRLRGARRRLVDEAQAYRFESVSRGHGLHTGYQGLLSVPSLGARTVRGHHMPDLIDRIIDQYMTVRSDSTCDRMLVVTSGQAGEGVTTIAINIALRSSRKLGFRVLYVPWDKRLDLPSLESAVHGDTVPIDGVAVRICDADDCGVSVIDPCSLEPLWRSGRTGPFLNGFVEAIVPRYDLVVLDAAPIASAGESLDLVRLGALSLLVVEAERTGGDLTQQSLQLMGKRPGRLLGTVLNKRRRYVPCWLGSHVA